LAWRGSWVEAVRKVESFCGGWFNLNDRGVASTNFSWVLFSASEADWSRCSERQF